jgi:hypothetical protein
MAIIGGWCFLLFTGKKCVLSMYWFSLYYFLYLKFSRWLELDRLLAEIHILYGLIHLIWIDPCLHILLIIKGKFIFCPYTDVHIWKNFICENIFYFFSLKVWFNFFINKEIIDSLKSTLFGMYFLNDENAKSWFHYS